MKVVILAGGFGTRISEYTENIPKPLITVSGKPIIVHIMEHYSSYGFKEFIIALGYKGETIKNYFLNYFNLQSDLEINKSGKIKIQNNKKIDWNIKLIDTGLNTFTGGRIKRLKNI
jgi:glucose-1-phosphate cytidylyltransferase